METKYIKEIIYRECQLIISNVKDIYEKILPIEFNILIQLDIIFKSPIKIDEDYSIKSINDIKIIVKSCDKIIYIDPDIFKDLPKEICLDFYNEFELITTSDEGYKKIKIKLLNKIFEVLPQIKVEGIISKDDILKIEKAK